LPLLLVVSLCLWLGFALGKSLWSHLRLPFANPLEVVGPLAGAKFNPTTNLLRYAVFVGLPGLLLLAAMAWPPLRRAILAGLPENAPGADENEPAWTRRLWQGAVALTVLYALGAAAAALQASGLQPVDIFHEGEFVSPAWNYLSSGGLWSRSYFVHGAFYDALASALGWKLFGHVSIGAMRATNMLLWAAVYGALAFALIALAAAAPGGRGSRALLLVLLLVTWLATGSLQFLDRRDVPVLLALGCIALGIAKARAWPFALAGLLSAGAFFYSIDRGAYLTAALLLVLAAQAFWQSDRTSRRQALALGVGLALGWLVFFVCVGSREFRAFAANTAMLFRTKDLFDSYVYPRPKLRLTDAHALPMMAIGLQLLGFLFFFWARHRQKPAGRFAVLHALFAALAFFYFRSALGRSDEPHVHYASTFAFLGLAPLVWCCLREVRAVRLHAGSTVLGAAAAVILGLSAVQLPGLRALVGTPARLRELAAVTDDQLLAPELRAARDRLAQLLDKDDCIFSLTSEAMWPYLLRKPSCGRFFVVWFASPKPLRDELLHELAGSPPRFILVRSPSGYEGMDGVANEQRFPEVYAFVAAHYQAFENVSGWEIYRRNDVAVEASP
jgi:hypothetical protein